MQELFREKLTNAKTLSDVRESVIQTFAEIKTKGIKRLGYVSGILNSDGPEQKAINIHNLQEQTQKLRGQHDFPIFSCLDIFSHELFDQITPHPVSEEDMYLFYREMLNSGYVTDIFMTPRWERSIGASDEHAAARKRGLTIHYVPS